MFIATLAWSSGAWGDNNSSYKTIQDFSGESSYKEGNFDNISGDNLSFSKSNHVTFKISGSGMSYYPIYKALRLQGNKSFKVEWALDNNYSINITKISLTARKAATSKSGYIALGSYQITATSDKTVNLTGSYGNEEYVWITTKITGSEWLADPTFFVSMAFCFQHI